MALLVDKQKQRKRGKKLYAPSVSIQGHVNCQWWEKNESSCNKRANMALIRSPEFLRRPLPFFWSISKQNFFMSVTCEQFLKRVTQATFLWILFQNLASGFRDFIWISSCTKSPLHRNQVYRWIKISWTIFKMGHPRNTPVKSFQNLTSHFREDFLRISSCP